MVIIHSEHLNACRCLVVTGLSFRLHHGSLTCSARIFSLLAPLVCFLQKGCNRCVLQWHDQHNIGRRLICTARVRSSGTRAKLLAFSALDSVNMVDAHAQSYRFSAYNFALLYETDFVSSAASSLIVLLISSRATSRVLETRRRQNLACFLNWET